MGVCKCKQRNVTNQFCYVCRTNVCESCMVKDHQRCIIKSYVHWLQDSDYSATCSLCLESISTGEVIRLTCYDLFHWDCFNSWAIRFSENTKPSNYTCPDCKAQVFPPAALVSPIADVLRQKFSTVGWGRKGMGLPSQTVNSPNIANFAAAPSGDLQTTTSTPKAGYKPLASVTPFVPLSKQQQQQQQQHVVQHQRVDKQDNPKIQPQASYNRDKHHAEGSTSRKLYDTRRYDEEKINLSYDHDENKYQRKGFLHWIGNLMRLWKKTPVGGSSKKDQSNLTFKRVLIALVIFMLAFMTVIYFMSVLGSRSAEDDPMLDPNFNPQVKFEGKFASAKAVARAAAAQLD